MILNLNISLYDVISYDLLNLESLKFWRPNVVDSCIIAFALISYSFYLLYIITCL